MLPRIVLWSIVVLGLVASDWAAEAQSDNQSDPKAGKTGVIRRLMSIQFDKLDENEICSTVENILRDFYHNVVADSSRSDLLTLALKDGLGENSSRVLAVLTDCMRIGIQSQHVNGGVDSWKQFPVTIGDQDITNLSRVRHETQKLSLKDRCSVFEDTLRGFLKNQPQSTADRATLFNTFIETLSSRNTPNRMGLRTEQNFLSSLRECVEKLSAYQTTQDSHGTEFDHDQDLHAAKRIDNLHYKDYPEEMDSSLSRHMSNYTDEEMFEQDQNHLNKLQMELERERIEPNRIRNQLEDRHDEVSDLKKHLEQLKNILTAGNSKDLPIAIDQDSPTKMKALLEQANERELRAKESIDSISRRITELEAKHAAAERVDYDNDNVDVYDDVKSKELTKALKKAKKGKGKKGDEKVYKHHEEIARKLQSMMNSSESPANRCQKYYMILNYPSKVTKQTIKTVAKLPLPIVSNNDPDYYMWLQDSAETLSQSGHKGARLAANEMKQCQRHDQHLNTPPTHSETKVIDNHELKNDWKNSGSTDQEIPVIYKNRFHPRKARSWHREHESLQFSDSMSYQVPSSSRFFPELGGFY